MPMRSATLRIVSASGPSVSRTSRAAVTICRARGVRRSGALEAIAGAEPVAEAAVEGDVGGPGHRADEGPPGARSRQREHRRAPVAVQGVVDAHGPGVELALLETPAEAEEEREVGAGAEDEERPPARVAQLDLHDRHGEQEHANAAKATRRVAS